MIRKIAASLIALSLMAGSATAEWLIETQVNALTDTKEAIVMQALGDPSQDPPSIALICANDGTEAIMLNLHRPVTDEPTALGFHKIWVRSDSYEAQELEFRVSQDDPKTAYVFEHTDLAVYTLVYFAIVGSKERVVFSYKGRNLVFPMEGFAEKLAAAQAHCTPPISEPDDAR